MSLPNELAPDLVPKRGIDVLYSPDIAALILDLYIGGNPDGRPLSMHAISKMEGMPAYATILRWAREHKQFSEQFKRARQCRAIHLEERAMEIADGVIDKDSAPGERLRFDIFKWGAEIQHPEEYGKKVTVAGDRDRPIVFKVLTGVPEPQSQLPSTQAHPDIEVVAVALGTGSSEVRAAGSATQEVAGSTPAPSTLTGSELLDRIAAETGITIPEEVPAHPDAEQDLT